MPPRPDDDLFQDDDSDDPYDDDDGDPYDDDLAAATIACWYCGHEVYEDAERCPHCEQYLSREEDRRGPAWPWWVWLGLGLAFLVVLWWLAP